MLAHQIPSRDLNAVLETLIELGFEQVEKRKFATTDRPRRSTSVPRANPRYVPAAVKRMVWRRDGARCTFVGTNGHRCEARAFVEFEHIIPVALGGLASVEKLRLLCRAHNHFVAEQAFGAEFMKKKREQAQRKAKEKRVRGRKAQNLAADP
jgi:hypothetical protein